jgi:hypothetical protein
MGKYIKDMEKGLVHFYSMRGCGWCTKSKELLKDQIAAGQVIMKDAKDAPPETRGFPYFESPVTGKSMSGYPGSEKELAGELGLGIRKRVNFRD